MRILFSDSRCGNLCVVCTCSHPACLPMEQTHIVHQHPGCKLGLHLACHYPSLSPPHWQELAVIYIAVQIEEELWHSRLPLSRLCHHRCWCMPYTVHSWTEPHVHAGLQYWFQTRSGVFHAKFTQLAWASLSTNCHTVGCGFGHAYILQ